MLLCLLSRQPSNEQSSWGNEAGQTVPAFSLYEPNDVDAVVTCFIVISFIFCYFVHSLCRTLVQPAAPCLVLKVN